MHCAFITTNTSMIMVKRIRCGISKSISIASICLFGSFLFEEAFSYRYCHFSVAVFFDKQHYINLPLVEIRKNLIYWTPYCELYCIRAFVWNEQEFVRMWDFNKIQKNVCEGSIKNEMVNRWWLIRSLSCYLATKCV